jgi:hypothetical protein
MTPKEQGRFCGSCQKIVVDFSVMTDKEILDYISTASRQVCGRFAGDQLNTDLQPTVIKKRFSWAYVWNILLATFLFTEANAQVKLVKKKKPEVQLPDLSPKVGTFMVVEKEQIEIAPKEIAGIVLDGLSHNLLAGASIYIEGTNKGVVTDSLGHFHFKVEKEDSLVLKISYIGFETQRVVVNTQTNWQDVKVIMMEQEATMGLIAVQVRKPAKKKAETKKLVNDWKPTFLKKDIKIYPNPKVRGNVIQAELSLKQTGEYQVELLNVEGQVISTQKLMMVAKEQKIIVPTQTGWSPGIYWIRISAPGVKNVYQGKVAIQ